MAKVSLASEVAGFRRAGTERRCLQFGPYGGSGEPMAGEGILGWEENEEDFPPDGAAFPVRGCFALLHSKFPNPN